MKRNNGNIVTVEAGDYKFVDFSNYILKHDSENQNTNWFLKLSELDGKIHSANMQERVTFADDRIVMAAYEILCVSEAFNNNAGLREWWILKRYSDIYMPDALELKEQIRSLITMYIGFNFSEAQMTEEQKVESKKCMKELAAQVFEEDYPQKFPGFFLELIEEGEMPENIFLGNEHKQWEELKWVASWMLGWDELTEEGKVEWEKALNEAESNLKTK